MSRTKPAPVELHDGLLRTYLRLQASWHELAELLGSHRLARSARVAQRLVPGIERFALDLAEAALVSRRFMKAAGR